MENSAKNSKTREEKRMKRERERYCVCVKEREREGEKSARLRQKQSEDQGRSNKINDLKIGMQSATCYNSLVEREKKMSST